MAKKNAKSAVKPKAAVRPATKGSGAAPANSGQVKLWKYSYKKFQLPTFRSPLEGESDMSFRDEVDHAFFLRCCELYRVLDLVSRTLDEQIEVYSKFRNRDIFKETLTFRYFDSEEALVARFDPKLAADLFFAFNLLYELRISLTYTDALPLTVKKEVDDAMWTLKEGWNRLTDGVEQMYGWKFKKLVVGTEG